MKNYYMTFSEGYAVSRGSQAKKFIENYGVDGEVLYIDYETSSHERIVEKYMTKPALRVFCRDCLEKKCKGKNWATCKYRIVFLIVVNKELERENKELKKIVENYKLGEVIKEE